MRRKALILSMVCTLGFSMMFTGCGNKTNKKANQSNSNVANTTNETTDSQNGSNNQDSQTDDTADASADQTESIEATRGTIEDGTYINNTFKISFPVTEDMTVFTDEQIAQAVGMGTDMIKDNSTLTPQQMEEAMAGCVYDTMIVFSDGSSNVSVSYQNMDITAKGVYLTADQFIQAMKTQIPTLTGTDYEFSDVTTVELGGQTYSKLVAKTSGLTQTYVARQVDNYMVNIVVTCAEGNEQLADDFLDSFVIVE